MGPVADRVQFTGFRDWEDLPAEYGKADVLCVPSLHDGWGLVVPEGLAEFTILPEMHAAGMTDYVAIINRFAAEGVIGDMDCVYSSWATGEPGGFTDGQVAALQQVVTFLALAIKSVSLAHMTGTLMQTYLGRAAGQRVLSGRILRGVADRIDAVIWFSDLRGFTRITDTAPEQAIPLLNDYADVVFCSHSRTGWQCS